MSWSSKPERDLSSVSLFAGLPVTKVSMTDIQKQIVQYDEAIRLKRFEESATLREKRDAVLKKLRDEFVKMRDVGRDVPTFEWFNQGSYEMGTGIDPTNGDYDIDVGLDFNVAKEKYPDPVKLKELVFEALDGHTPLGTAIRRSCVTVNYQVAGEQAYHVDLAVYACDNPESTPHSLHIAKGKQHSETAHRFWESSDPKGLTAWVEERFSGDAEKQFLRAVRMLKGWKSFLFEHNGNGAPSGIGLTIAAGRWFQPEVSYDAVTKVTTCDDRKALRNLVDAMIRNFDTIVSTENPGKTAVKLTVKLPVSPWNDVFTRMTEGQMATFKIRLEKLREVLDEVSREEDPVEACKKMQAQFGERFPVPPKQDTAQPRGRAITSSGVSA